MVELLFGIALCIGLVGAAYNLGQNSVHPDYAKHEFLALHLGYSNGVFDLADLHNDTAWKNKTCEELKKFLSHKPEIPGFDVTHTVAKFTSDMKDYCDHYENDPSYATPDANDQPDGAVTENGGITFEGNTFTADPGTCITSDGKGKPIYVPCPGTIPDAAISIGGDQVQDPINNNPAAGCCTANGPTGEGLQKAPRPSPRTEVTVCPSGKRCA